MPKRAPRYGTPGHQHHGKDVGGRPWTGYLVVPTPRGPRIGLRSVSCPDCPAVVGEPCMGMSAPSTVHYARRRLATRAFNLQREAYETYESNIIHEVESPHGMGTCTGCGQQVRLIKAREGDSYLGIQKGDLVIGRHPPLGEKQSKRQGGGMIWCKGAGLDAADS